MGQHIMKSKLEHFQSSPTIFYVSRWERGGEEEGGDGVSVAFFH